MLRDMLGKILAGYISKPLKSYSAFAVAGSDTLHQVLQPGDVLLVEGDLRISLAIKYLTQSTWSHAALYVGDLLKGSLGYEGPMLVEADLEQGVIAVPLSKYETFNTRICRPVNLSAADQSRVLQYAIDRIGYHYDLKNVLDLMRYLIRKPPVPAKWRRRMLALGSGDPTRAICSTLIAQAYQSVQYPILPHIDQIKVLDGVDGYSTQEIMHIRHYSLFTPRDFDLSPYFEVVKPTIASGFDYKKIIWRQEGPKAVA